MERCALFVDAGYALADGAMAVHGTRRRDSVSWDHAGLLKLLAGLAKDRTGLPVLRCYWYEAADGGRTAEHDALAEMPGLKLRLVNTRPGRREGIESQLRRDIVTLAKSGAIADAFIASADEHLAEIVAEVQDLGLRVVVLHIASDGGWTIPQPLRQECDDIVEISAVHLRPFVDLIRGAEPAGPDEQYAGSGYGSRSRADGAGLAADASSASGVPAQALPASAAYPASGRGDSSSAQPYPGSASPAFEPAASGSRSPAPEQALMAVRSPDSAAGPAQFGTSQFTPPKQDAAAAQVNGSGQAASLPHDGPSQGGGAPYREYGGAERQPASGQHAAPDRGTAQHASPSHAQHGGQAPGQHAGQGSAPHHASQGRTAQHPAHAALEALEQGGGYAADGPRNVPSGGNVKHGHASPPGLGAPGAGQQGAGAGGSGGFLNGGFQGAGFPAGPGPADAGQHDGYQGSAGTAGPAGAAGPAPSPTVHHLSGLSFPAGTAGSSHNGAPGSASGNGATPPSGHHGSYPNGSGQNGTAVHGAPPYQNGSSRNTSGEYGSFGSYQPGASGNGSQLNAGLPGGGPANPAGNGAPVNGNAAGGGRANMNPAGFDAAPFGGQPTPYGAMDPGYFPGQEGAGQQASHPGGQQGTGTHARDAYAPARDSYGPDRDAYGPPQPEPSFQPRAAQSAPAYHAHQQLPPQGAQPPPPVPAIRPAQPVAISLPEAVKAAHSEGYTFGESVGRDAPGLWLEAVLARKPRMPSDLEARLLQGSVLPIDSLLHDEVRHSLRRGFWEALESARR